MTAIRYGLVLVLASVLGRQAAWGEAAFAQKPEVGKQGDRWIISFTVKEECDAAVAVLDGNGRTIRHLASGLLGGNAPEPFKKGSLAQSLEWNGKDDAGAAAPAGCRIRVSLGLKPALDRMLTVGGDEPAIGDPWMAVVDSAGTLYVGDASQMSGDYRVMKILAFDREGKYLRTVFPVPATLPPEKARPVRFMQFPGGATFPENSFHVAGRQQTVAVTAEGRIVFARSPDYQNTILCAVGTDSSVPEDWRGSLIAPKGPHGDVTTAPARRTLPSRPTAGAS